MFVDWKTYHYKDDKIPKDQSTNSTQLFQILAELFAETDRLVLKTHMVM